MKDFVREMQFDRLGIFQYSHEEQTHSFAFKDDVPADIKQERADEIMAIQEEISLSINQQKIGKTLKVLFDRTEGGYFIGRTEHDSPEVDNEVLVKAEEKAYARMGDFALVNISSATEFDLYGTLA